MTITAALRSAAIATAVVGFIDPSWTARRRAPVAVELIAPVTTDGEDLRHRLARSLGNEVTFNSEAEPAAVVVVGGTTPRSALSRAGVTVSTVSIGRPASPNVRVVAADEPDNGRVGWSAVFHGVIEANGLAGRSSRIVLEAHGTELAHVEHRWTRDSERFDATLRYTPPASGTSTMTLRVMAAEGDTTDADNAADLRLVASARRLSVLVHEPRPSWNATFIRRALEQDPSFEVSSLVQASRGLEVRAGTPPGALTADALSAFDAVVIGAPEELRPSEVEALRLFARRRGGAVVLVPDRRPSGPYLELIPAPQFDEVLVENAIELRAPGDRMASIGVPLRASEIVVTARGCPAVRCWRRSKARARKTRRRDPWWSSGLMAPDACSSRGPWTPGASAPLQTTDLRGSGGRGLPKAPRRRRRASRSALRRVFLDRAKRVTIRARLRPTEFEEGAPGRTATACGPRSPRRVRRRRASHSLVANGGGGSPRGPIGSPGHRAGTISRSAPPPARPSMRSSAWWPVRDIHRPRRRTPPAASSPRRRGASRSAPPISRRSSDTCGAWRAGKSSARSGPADRGC